MDEPGTDRREGLRMPGSMGSTARGGTPVEGCGREEPGDVPGKPPLGAADRVLAAILGAITLVVAAQILWRYVFGDSLLWSEEASRYLFVWMTFIGAAIAVGEGSHVRVGSFVASLPDRARSALELGSAVLTLLYLAFLGVVGILWVDLNADTPSPALGLPLNWALYAALPAGSLLGLLLGLRHVVRGLARRHREEE